MNDAVPRPDTGPEQGMAGETASGSVGPERGLCAGDVMATNLMTVDAADGLLLTWELVSQAGVHQIPVIERGRCVGLISERDLAVEVARNPIGHTRRLVREIVDGTPAYVEAETPISVVAQRLLRTGKDATLVHTPTGQLIGLVTVHDLLRALAGQVRPRQAGQQWDYSPALFRLTPVLPVSTPESAPTQNPGTSDS